MEEAIAEFMSGFSGEEFKAFKVGLIMGSTLSPDTVLDAIDIYDEMVKNCMNNYNLNDLDGKHIVYYEVKPEVNDV